MSVWILHDPELKRAVFLESSTETPFGEAFVGDLAVERASEFLEWCESNALRLNATTFVQLSREFIHQRGLPNSKEP